MSRLWRWSMPGLVLVLAACTGAMSKRPDTGDIGQMGDPVGERSPADIYVQLGSGYLRQGRYDIALQKLNRGLELDPDNAQVHNVLGFLYERLGEVSLARKHYQIAIDLQPKNPDIRNAYGVFLCAQGDYERAVQQFRDALKNPLYRSPQVALTNAGSCAGRIPDPARAETFFRQALERDPRYAPALLQMARISLEQDNHLSARAYLQRYTEVAEHTPASLWLGVRIERVLQDLDALASYELLLRSRFPDSVETGRLLESSKQ